MLSTTKKLALVLAAMMAFGVAQTPPAAQDKPAPADKPAKVAKDQAEADLINSIPKETDPAKRLKILDQWTKDYPDTAFATERQAEYFRAYTDLKDCKNQSKIAASMLNADPNSEVALRTIIGCIYSMKGPDASDFQLAEKAAGELVANADTIYADDKKPAGTSSAQWQQLKGTMVVAAKNTIPYIDIQKKDDAKAEADLTKLLQSDPSNAQASYMLAGVLFGQRQAHPEKQPPAIFEYARAGAYDGPNSLPAAARSPILTTAGKYYKQYHGSDEGWDKVVAAAKTNALPPSDLAIESTADIAIRKAKEEEDRDKADPVGTIWRNVHDGLTGDNDAAFWNDAKDSGLPSTDGSKKFKGKLVSQKPAISPKTLVIAVKDPAGDVTLQLDMPLRGKMEPGAELEFYGTATAYVKSPYMLTLKVDDPKTQIVGWKPVAAPVTPKKGAATAKKRPQ